MPPLPELWDHGSWDEGTWDLEAETNNPNNPMANLDLAQIRANQTWIDELTTLLDAVIAHLEEKAVPLSAEQRRKHRGIGPENASMIDNGVALVRDHADWFPGTFARAELLLDVTDRTLWLLPKGKVMELNELYFDTLQAVSADIARVVTKARMYIEEGAEATGTGNDQVAEYLEYFKRFGNQDDEEEPPVEPTPPTP